MDVVGLIIGVIFGLTFGLALVTTRLWFALQDERARAHAVRPFVCWRGDPTVRALFLGDSLAVGVGASSPTTSTAGRFAQDFPEVEVENVARSGSRVKDLAGQLDAAAHDQYDLIVVQIGGNDVAFFSDVGEVERQLTDALHHMHERAPVVMLLNMGDIGRCPRFHWPFTRIFHKRSRQMRRVFRRVARRTHTSFVDLMRRRYDPTRSPEFMAADGIHLNDSGYELVYRAFKRIFQKLPGSQTLLIPKWVLKLE